MVKKNKVAKLTEKKIRYIILAKKSVQFLMILYSLNTSIINTVQNILYWKKLFIPLPLCLSRWIV